MDTHQRVLFVDATTHFYRIDRYAVGQPFFGPVDLGLHLAGRFNSLNIGSGLLAGSIFPGSNRLIVTGFSPAWGGFYVSTMGGAALVFDNLGINMLSIVGRAGVPSVLYLNRKGGEHIEVEVSADRPGRGLGVGPGGFYGLMQPCLRALRRSLRNGSAHSVRRPRGSGNGFRRHRLGAHQRRPDHPHRHLGRTRRLRLEAAAAAQHLRDHLRRHVRRRRFSRSEGGRPVVCRSVREATQSGRFRRHDQVSLRSRFRNRRHVGRQLRQDGRPTAVLQLPQHLRHGRGAVAASTISSSSTTT